MSQSDASNGTPDIQIDPVSNVLKWILLITAILCFLIIIWGTVKTYQQAPPLPQKFIASSGQTIMTEEDIIAGKAGFQRADLMDYGSLYGMGSYFGEDYTAKYLVRLGRLIEEKIAQQRFGKPFVSLSEGDQYVVRKTMQHELQQIDLSHPTSILSEPIAEAIQQIRIEISHTLLNHDTETGWTKAYSLDEQSALQTAAFLIYSSLTTIAHRPGQNSSYTNNWPYEPSMGNNPTSHTFYWTWVSFCFVFLGFGAVLYIYHRYLSAPDNAPKTPVFLDFEPLTPSQRKVGQYFVIVALVLLAQIAVGALLAHYYAKRTDFYGIQINDFYPLTSYVMYTFRHQLFGLLFLG